MSLIQRNEASRVLNHAYQGETYYGRPSLKRSPWGHAVGTYLFVAGLAGASQILAAIFKLVRPATSESVVRSGRIAGTAGAALGATLLVIDLRTRQRWYNMLRIFRTTSPMSIGTYLLSTFGLFTGVTFMSELFRGRRGALAGAARRAADVAQVPAAVAGAGMATYTAALLSSTSNPRWAAVPRQLGVEFAASSVASAAAALSLSDQILGEGEHAAALDSIAGVATLVHLISSFAEEQRLRALGVRATGPSRRRKRLADLVIAGALPLALYGLDWAGGRSQARSLLAAAAILGGNYLSRQATLESGNESADRPQDYFRLARPDHMPALASQSVRNRD